MISVLFLNISALCKDNWWEINDHNIKNEFVSVLPNKWNFVKPDENESLGNFGNKILNRLNYQKAKNLFANEKISMYEKMQLPFFNFFHDKGYRGKLFYDLKIGKRENIIRDTWLYVCGIIEKNNFKFFVHPYAIKDDAAETDSPWQVIRHMDFKREVRSIRAVFDKIKPAEIYNNTLVQNNLIDPCAAANLTNYSVILKQIVCKANNTNLRIVNIIKLKDKSYETFCPGDMIFTDDRIHYGVFVYKISNISRWIKGKLTKKQKNDFFAIQKFIPSCSSII
jgi:hypothetical protein